MTTNPPNENSIRDFLAERLDMVEPGLTLIDREHYLKNSQGAAGFLDIFAKDTHDRLVIIEIKRTDTAAREAIHELYKYSALLREKYLLRDVEYRLMLLSVEWHGLLVPYSEFAKTAPFDLLAGRIALDTDGWPTRIDPVSTVATAAQRRFSRRHFLWRFEAEAKATAAIPLIAAHMKEAGIDDFVLIRSHSNNPLISEKCFLYFAQQELTLTEYRQRIRLQLSDAEYEEFEENMADLIEEEDRVSEAADAVWYPGYDDLFGRIHCDHSEISHPEKASHWFAEGAQRDIMIERFGRFIDARLLDNTILSELIGQTGGSDYHLRQSASTISRPQMEALRTSIANVFFFNSEWRNAGLDLLSYAERTGPATTRITAFSNEDVLRSVAGAAFGYPAYIPSFRLEIEREGQPVETFLGVPEWDGTSFDFDAIMKAHFGADPFDYFITHHFGSTRGINADIMADLGLRYIIFRMGEDGPERVRVAGSSIVGSPRPTRGSVFSLIDANVDEVHKIVGLFMTHDEGFRKSIEVWLNNDFNVAERVVRARIEQLHPADGECYWIGKIELCGLCHRHFNTAQFMIDARVGGGGANVCAQCYLEDGNGGGAIFAATRKGWLLLGTDLPSAEVPGTEQLV
ncbi:endonuclease NucS domain-containing protein [Paraburkholderia sp. SOS3]|uniref:endonuclease NucS domain-containing protein n=1 Tax=Paraburkholderia sp. SOS3 TaxID=1926494 RepID=UPI00094764C6|nr:endonuclease NucS domain-containing protein [Paraburkholderia sp. SOS3]APR36674.1 hypothetical protein BTO02_16100 [Paraburkholderia sp. SOS3]